MSKVFLIDNDCPDADDIELFKEPNIKLLAELPKGVIGILIEGEIINGSIYD